MMAAADQPRKGKSAVLSTVKASSRQASMWPRLFSRGKTCSTPTTASNSTSPPAFNVAAADQPRKVFVRLAAQVFGT